MKKKTKNFIANLTMISGALTSISGIISTVYNGVNKLIEIFRPQPKMMVKSLNVTHIEPNYIFYSILIVIIGTIILIIGFNYKKILNTIDK